MMTLIDILRAARRARCALTITRFDGIAAAAFTPMAHGARGCAATGATVIDALEALIDARVVNDDALRTLEALAQHLGVDAVEIAFHDGYYQASVYENRVRTRFALRARVERALADLARQVIGEVCDAD